jgi:hypothetical protein
MEAYRAVESLAGLKYCEAGCAIFKVHATRVFALLDGAGKSYLFLLHDNGKKAVESAFAFRGALSVGKRF